MEKFSTERITELEKAISAAGSCETINAGEMLTSMRMFSGESSPRVVAGMAFMAGIAEGKRQERARRKCAKA